MRGPRPPMGRVNGNYGSGGPGAFGYGRSGTLYEGQNYRNSYMEAETGRSTSRCSFPVYKGDWKSFKKNCLAEAHIAGVNEAIPVAVKAHSRQWVWPFTPDPARRQRF